MTAGRGGLYGEVGHTCFQTSNLRAVVVVRVRGVEEVEGGVRKAAVGAKEMPGMRVLHSVQACIGDL